MRGSELALSLDTKKPPLSLILANVNGGQKFPIFGGIKIPM
jgi:hypothetical protein